MAEKRREKKSTYNLITGQDSYASQTAQDPKTARRMKSLIPQLSGLLLRELSEPILVATLDGNSPIMALAEYDQNVFTTFTPGTSGSGSGPDPVGGFYITDIDVSVIRKVTAGIISTICGTGTGGFSGDGGPAASAQLNLPYKTVLDAAGNLYIADSNNARVRVINTQSTPQTILGVSIPAGAIKTVAGTGTPGDSGDAGPATSAQISQSISVALDSGGNLYITDTVAARVRKVTTGGTITTVAGNGTTGFSGDGSAATAAQLHSPQDCAVDAAGNIYIADAGNSRIRVVNVQGTTQTILNVSIPSHAIKTVAGNGTLADTGDGGQAVLAEVKSPNQMALDPTGNLYWPNGDALVRKILTTGIISKVAGTGVAGFSGDTGLATAAQVNQPTGIWVDGTGNIYIADSSNFRVRYITFATGIITTIAGNGVSGNTGDGGPATSAELTDPFGVIKIGS